MSADVLTINEVAELLAWIPADDRETWIKVGGILKDEFGDAGFDVWDRWSQGSDKYKEKDARAAWRSLKANNTPATTRSLYYLARQNGWRPDPEAKPTPRPARPQTHQEPRGEPQRWSGKAEAIWSRARPLDGADVASRYLLNRACALPPEDADLRWLPASGRYQWPTMVARITDAITCDPLSLHFTYLALDGSGKAPIPKNDQRRLLKDHMKAGGCIRLWPDDCVTLGLAIAEGIESALATAHAFTPIWSCIDEGNMAAFPVLTGIEAITIAADHDKSGTGQAAAQACARRWHDAGREVRIVLPPTPGQDMADVGEAA